MTRRVRWGDATALALGLAFLYVPMFLVVTFSFNASRLVTVWGGFSTRWYAALFESAALRQAAGISLVAALASALLATCLGTFAAVALVRFGHFHTRTLFTALVYAPLVLPEVVTGLSLLLLFVAVGLERGIGTIVIAHTTLTLSFVTLVVQARLVALDPVLEEAARDLGASPLRAFLTVTLPLIGPAVAAGFLLAFTLSLDDLVLASFTSGPGATTLPMRIYGGVRLGLTPEINAAASLLILVVGIALVSATLVSKIAGRRRPA